MTGILELTKLEKEVEYVRNAPYSFYSPGINEIKGFDLFDDRT